MAGGVSANQLLRQEMERHSKLPVYYPPLNLCTYNAAMIAAAGASRLERGERTSLDVGADPGLELAP